jgi:AcrR family transcriptional regulator
MSGAADSRAALVDAGRRLFGGQGFAATSIADLAREAGLAADDFNQHFPTKSALFEAVFAKARAELTAASTVAARGATSGLDELARGFDAYLDGVALPDLQRILVVDAPAVLGLARYTELDEGHAHEAIVATLTSAAEAGAIEVEDPETATRLLLGALIRGAMLIAKAPDPVKTRDTVARQMRTLLKSFTPTP